MSGRPALVAHLDHLRDDVAGALHDHGVADPDVLALDVVFVVQGGAGDHDAADGHRLERRDRREGAGATHLHRDPDHPGLRLLGGELERDRPARRAADEAQAPLVVDAIDLHDDAVDIVGQLEALCPEPLVVGDHRGLVRAALGQRIDAKAPLVQPVEEVAVRALDRRYGFAPAIGEEAQPTSGGDARVQLAQRASREVARVCEQRFPAASRAAFSAMKSARSMYTSPRTSRRDGRAAPSRRCGMS